MAVLSKRTIAGLLGLTCSFLILDATAATLDAALLPRVRAATFEVVAAKADESKVVYEKPFPFDQIPYQERTDKYRSVGTAFFIGEGHFVTAAHVFTEGVDSLQGPLSLRDEQGHVFAIDKVLKYSPQEDFVEFSVTNAPAIQPLEIERSPAVNETVYAVGNALGTGVVLRDGLYTSDTPEEEQGRWKWMRFSAPASPGNSGGPLIDDKGKVIGVVLRKSPNENLNFALPISRVLDASDKQADIDLPEHFNPGYSATMYATHLRTTFALPLSHADFNKRVSDMYNGATHSAAQAWQKEHGATVFPFGNASHAQLIRGAYGNSLPALIVQSADGAWEREESAFGKTPVDKGYIVRRMHSATMFWHIHTDADHPQGDTGGRATLEQLLQLGDMTRTIDGDKIKLRSLGDPISTESFTDRLGRPWRVDIFALPFADVAIVLATTTTPDGASGMLHFDRARLRQQTALQLTLMTDLLDIGYFGTTAQWQGYLAAGNLPTALHGAAFRAEGQGVHLSIDGIKVAWPASVVPQGDRTAILVKPSWTMEDGKAALHVRELAVSQADAPGAMISVERYERYFDDSEPSAKTFWDDLLAHAHPRSGQMVDNGERRFITEVYDPASPESAGHAYTLSYAIGDKTPEETMHARFNDAKRGTSVPDGKAPASPAP